MPNPTSLLRFPHRSDLAAWGSGTTSDYDDLEKLLRQNLRLRRVLGAEVVKAKYRSANWRGDRTWDSKEIPRPTPFEDDLEELRRELKLRRERRAKLTRTEHDSQKSVGGVAYRVGQLLYWACLMLGLIWIGACLFMAIDSSGDQNQLAASATLAVILIPPLLLHGIGEDLRFALSGK